MKYPVEKTKFNLRRKRFIAHCRAEPPTMAQIDPIFNSECAMICYAYYGGRFPAIWAMLKESVWLLRMDIDSRFQMWFCDRMGWTKLYPLPGTPVKLRHGRQCHGSPNCDDMGCIDRAIPRWFKFISRWDKRHE